MVANTVDSLKNTIIYLRQTLVTTLVPFVVLLVVARYVTPEDFGIYALSQVYAIVATGLFSLGLHVGYERNYFKYSRDKASLSALHNSVLGFVTLSFGFAGLLTVVSLESVASILGVSNHSLLLTVLLGQSLDRIAQLYLIYFRNTENARYYSRYMIAAATINAAVSVTLVIQYDLGVLGLAIGHALSWLIVIFFMFSTLLKEISFRLDWLVLKEALTISLPVTPRTLVVVMGAQSDKYILGLLGTVGGVGLYNIAFRISSVINSYMIALQNAYTPSLYKMMFAEDPSAQDGVGQYLSLITYFSILPAIFVALFANEMVWVLLPEIYADAAGVLIVLATYYGVLFFGKISGVQLIFAKKTGITTLLSIVFAILNIALNIPLISYYGVLGAAFATLLTGSLYTLTSYFVAQRYSYIAWEGKVILGIVLTLIISGFIALLLSLSAVNLQLAIAIKLLLALWYCFLGLRHGFVSRENFTKLMQGLRIR